MPAVASTGIIEGAKTRTYLAGVANLSRGTLVVQGADDSHVVPSGANAFAFGVVNETVVSIGDPVSVTRIAEATAICGAPVTAGSPVVSDASGHAILSTATGDRLAGYAISSTAVAGDYFVLFVLPSIR